MRKMASLCLTFLLLAGCAITPPIRTSEDVFLKSSVDIDPYKKTTWIYSPIFRNYEGMGYYYAFLRALVTDKSVTIYQFYISDTSKDWRFFDRAYDSNGIELDFLGIDHQVTDSAFTQEDFAINLSRAYLDHEKTNWLNIKAIGKRGEKIFVLPGFYIEGFIKKVDEYAGK